MTPENRTKFIEIRNESKNQQPQGFPSQFGESPAPRKANSKISSKEEKQPDDSVEEYCFEDDRVPAAETYSNDPKQSTISALQKGMIWKPIGAGDKLVSTRKQQFTKRINTRK
jgi:hypothetical protein